MLHSDANYMKVPNTVLIGPLLLKPFKYVQSSFLFILI